MRTFMLVKKDKGQIIDIAGPCIEQDLIFDDGLEAIDECLFKALYPEQYKTALLENLIPAIATWIDDLYCTSKHLEIENGAIFTSEFIIQPTASEVHVMLYCNCSPSEASVLVLHLRKALPDDIEITITQLPVCMSECYGN